MKPQTGNGEPKLFPEATTHAAVRTLDSPNRTIA